MDFEITATELVKDIEEGRTDNIEAQMHEFSPEDRLALARTMEHINQAHVEKDPSLPDLEIETGEHQGKEYLYDLRVSTPGALWGRNSETICDEKWGESIRRYAETSSEAISGFINKLPGFSQLHEAGK